MELCGRTEFDWVLLEAVSLPRVRDSPLGLGLHPRKIPRIEWALTPSFGWVNISCGYPRVNPHRPPPPPPRLFFWIPWSGIFSQIRVKDGISLKKYPTKTKWTNHGDRYKSVEENLVRYKMSKLNLRDRKISQRDKYKSGFQRQNEKHWRHSHTKKENKQWNMRFN